MLELSVTGAATWEFRAWAKPGVNVCEFDLGGILMLAGGPGDGEDGFRRGVPLKARGGRTAVRPYDRFHRVV